MKRQLRDRIWEQDGLAMPMALLLFLVCAMLASVVLAAATTSVGAATALKETEQSYYAVTSAAKLFRDQLDGQTVVITQTKTEAVSDGAPAYTLNIDGASSLVAPSLLQLAAVSVLTGADQSAYAGALQLDSLASAAWGYFGQDASFASLDSNFALNASVTGTASGNAGDIQEALGVNVLERILPDGTVEFTFSQAKADDAQDQESYRLRLRLSADIDADEEVAEISAGTQVETRETRVTWWADELMVPEGTAAS